MWPTRANHRHRRDGSLVADGNDAPVRSPEDWQGLAGCPCGHVWTATVTQPADSLLVYHRLQCPTCLARSGRAGVLPEAHE
jgi:hypothetical protein